jgi:hypothetical protein
MLSFIYVFMFFDMFYILWPSGQIGSVEYENKVKVEVNRHSNNFISLTYYRSMPHSLDTGVT